MANNQSTLCATSSYRDWNHNLCVDLYRSDYILDPLKQIADILFGSSFSFTQSGILSSLQRPLTLNDLCSEISLIGYQGTKSYRQLKSEKFGDISDSHKFNLCCQLLLDLISYDFNNGTRRVFLTIFNNELSFNLKVEDISIVNEYKSNTYNNNIVAVVCSYKLGGSSVFKMGHPQDKFKWAKGITMFYPAYQDEL